MGKAVLVDKIEEHLELNPKLKKEILKSATQIKNKKVKTLTFEQVCKKAYG